MTQAPPDVIIIRGAPGSGKSQTSKVLTTHFPAGVRLEVDTLRSMVISVDWTCQTEHINILSLATGLVLGFINLGYAPVIVVDTFSGDKLIRFLGELRSLKSSLGIHTFAIVVATEVLRARVKNRPAGQFKDLDTCEKLNSDVGKYLLTEEHLIDNTALSPEQTADAIMKSLSGAK